MQDVKNADPKFTPSIMPDVPFGIARPEQVIGLSGLEAIRSIPTGALPAPPMARTLQQWIETAAKGRAEFRGNPSQEYLNPMGLVHGGWTMALLDSAMGCAVLCKPFWTRAKSMYRLAPRSNFYAPSQQKWDRSAPSAQ